MKLVKKKEVKHSVVYEAEDQTLGKEAIRSVYINKLWLNRQSASVGSLGEYPETIEIDVRVL